MSENVAGFLEVGITETGEVVINHPDLKPDENGVGHIVFSPDQAQYLAHLLIRKAGEAAASARRKSEDEARRAAEAIPVDRSAVTLADGSPVTADHRKLKENGQQNGYVVLSDAERAKGFVRPVRRSYLHKVCGSVTSMGQSIAETYARDPKFYSGTFCVECGKHFPLTIEGEPQFTWVDDDTAVGS